MGQLRYLANVATLNFLESKCIGCGMCVEVCPHGVFSMNGKKAQVVDRDACMECGACAMNCPVEAIAVKRGVGCAAAIINSYLNRDNPSCCNTDIYDSTPLVKKDL